MAEEIIDFGNFGRKITVSPSIPLQLINIKCRNDRMRVQATLLGKVYSAHIDILELVPVALCEDNKVHSFPLRSRPSILLNTNAHSKTSPRSTPPSTSLE